MHETDDPIDGAALAEAHRAGREGREAALRADPPGPAAGGLLAELAALGPEAARLVY